MNISIFITNWNGYKHGYLQEALPSIVEASKNYTVGKYEIILVDDQSDDSSVEFVKNNFPQVKIVIPEKNLGFQGASNFAVKYCQYEILISLNNDIKLEKNVLDKIVRHFEDRDVFAVSTRVLLWDEKTYLAGKRTAKIEKGHFKLIDVGDSITDVSETIFATGGAAAFRKSMYDELGGFDTIYYPLYWEDVDLCYRALTHRWKVIYDPSCLMFHKHQATIKKMYDGEKIGIITARNSYVFFWKNITDLRFIIDHIFYTFIFHIRDVFRLQFRFIIAWFMALEKIPAIIKYRITSQKINQRDRDILNRL